MVLVLSSTKCGRYGSCHCRQEVFLSLPFDSANHDLVAIVWFPGQPCRNGRRQRVLARGLLLLGVHLVDHGEGLVVVLFEALLVITRRRGGRVGVGALVFLFPVFTFAASLLVILAARLAGRDTDQQTDDESTSSCNPILLSIIGVSSREGQRSLRALIFGRVVVTIILAAGSGTRVLRGSGVRHGLHLNGEGRRGLKHEHSHEENGPNLLHGDVLEPQVVPPLL